MSKVSKSGKITRRRYSEEFKRDAVELVTEQGYSMAEAARSLGVHANLIRYWKDKLVEGKDEKQNSVLSESERAELHRLREENRKLRMEREIFRPQHGI